LVECFYFPIDRAELAQVWILLSIMCARFTSRKAIVPPAAPIVIEIRFYWIGPWSYTGVMPQEVMACPLIDEVKDLGAGSRKDTHLEQLVLEPDQTRVSRL
jgi:hypothetical protein